MQSHRYIETHRWNPRTKQWEKIGGKLQRKEALNSWREYRRRNAELDRLKESAPPPRTLLPVEPPRKRNQPKILIGKGQQRRGVSKQTQLTGGGQ